MLKIIEEFVRRSASAIRPAPIAAAFICLGALLVLLIVGSRLPDLLPYAAAALVAGATLFVTRRLERRRRADDRPSREPLPRTAAGPAPPPAPRPTAARRLVDARRIVEIDYAYNILGGSAAPPDMPAAAQSEWRQLRARGLSSIPSPDELSAFFRRYAMLTPQRQELIADYLYYAQNRKHRRPEIWVQRQTWFQPG